MPASAANSTDVHFELRTSRITQDDGCMQWLISRYKHAGGGDSVMQAGGKAADTDALLTRLMNDLSACSAHRWAHFAHHSPVYEATARWRESGKSSATEVRIITNKETETDVGSDITVTVHDSSHHVADAERKANDALVVEPSRHIVAAVLHKRRQELIASNVEAAARGRRNSVRAVRPFFGGYFAPSPGSSLTRFLVFPQWMHVVGSMQPQEIPYLLRGSIDGRCIAAPSMKPKHDAGLLQLLLHGIIVNASLLCKFTRATPRWHLFNDVDAIRVDMYANNRNSETLYLCSDSAEKGNCSATVSGFAEQATLAEEAAGNEAKITTVKFQDGGIRAWLFSRNPRHSIMLDIAHRVADRSKAKRQTITSFVIADEFDSAVQRFTTTLLRRWLPHATYSLRWMVGPGVEFLTGETTPTVFAKAKTAWWIETPISLNRMLLRLRNQSALVQPLALYSQGYPQNDMAQRESEDATLGYAARTHSLFWSTQGPRWDANLVRGFHDRYKAMHYASRWYTLWSAEVILNKQKQRQGRKVKNVTWLWPTGMLYANACFIDSVCLPPRASVGFSLIGTPRTTLDEFSALTTFSFECSFNWLLKFTPKSVSLVSGVVEGQPTKEAALQLSPVESFHHFRCGLTWNLGGS